MKEVGAHSLIRPPAEFRNVNGRRNETGPSGLTTPVSDAAAQSRASRACPGRALRPVEEGPDGDQPEGGRAQHP